MTAESQKSKASFTMGCLYLAGGVLVMLLASRFGNGWLAVALALWFLLFSGIRYRIGRCKRCGRVRVFYPLRGNMTWRGGSTCSVCGEPFAK